MNNDTDTRNHAAERAQVARWGPRCDTFDPACPACHAWRMFDMDRDTIPSVRDVMTALEEND